MYRKLLTYFSLFGSLATLLCCALPVVLVSLGLGAVFASLSSALPQITWIAQQKTPLFIFTGLILLLSIVLHLYSNRQSCPIDQDQKEACTKAKKIAQPVLIFSVIAYAVGLVFSYVLPWVFYG